MASHDSGLEDAIAHLTPEHWRRANRLLVRKALAEFAHERLITPQRLPGGRYAVWSDDGSVEYRFSADVLALEHWAIDAAGITRRTSDGAELPLDALDLVLDLRHSLGIDARYDLFTERFPLSCLNRLQLRNNRQMVDLQNPAKELQIVGTLANPIAPFAPA